MLAFYVYPHPKGTEYTEEDLRDRNRVIELFGYCGLWLGWVTKEGWNFLINLYGFEKLYEMDKEALWYDCETIEEYIYWVTEDMETSED